ncbi:MAG: helix-turn-helix transcriptional regulator [Lachnospiraceae bacterium]|nr:helix-turn-helix transcriptional regulator [Lachnospiraceae bacterium]
MQYKTSMREFEPYGSVYEESIHKKMHNMISRVNRLTPDRTINQLLHFDSEVYLEMNDGMAAIVIGFSPNTDDLKVFSIHRKVRLNPGVYFAIVSISSESTCRLITSSGFSMETIELDSPYYFNRILPHIQIREIFGYYYNVRNAGYNFQGEKHDYYELTFVDRGTLETTIENKQFIINEKELMIYGPGQFHTQHIAEGQSCSYVTIVFSMVNISPDAQNAENALLLNKVFSYDKKIYTLLKDFVQESSIQIPYINSLMTCLLQEIVIRLLRSEFLVTKEERPVSLTRQHYQDELLERILNYIEQSICEPLTIAEICQKFSISRSSLQLLFKENLDQTPKKYISDLKLEKSCQLIREQKYSISEISLLLGFNSIHYFSRAFAHKYNMAPSEYSKQMFNQI